MDSDYILVDMLVDEYPDASECVDEVSSSNLEAEAHVSVQSLRFESSDFWNSFNVASFAIRLFAYR